MRFSCSTLFLHCTLNFMRFSRSYSERYESSCAYGPCNRRHTVGVFAECIIYNNHFWVNLLAPSFFVIIRRPACLYWLCNRSIPFLDFFVLELRQGRVFQAVFLGFWATLRDCLPLLWCTFYARCTRVSFEQCWDNAVKLFKLMLGTM